MITQVSNDSKLSQSRSSLIHVLRPAATRSCPLDSPSAQDFGDVPDAGPLSGQTLGAVKEEKFEWNLAKEQAGAFF